MKTVILQSFEDETTGEIGFGVKGMPRDETTNAAIDGLTIAHDLIEHINGAKYIGTIDDELEALGAIWYVRGQHGELRRDGVGGMYSIEQNIASDVTRMFRDYVDGDQYVDFKPLKTRASFAEESLQEILNWADKSYLGEFDSDGKDEACKEWPKYRAHALHRLRMGYSKARRKYEKHGQYHAYNLFWAIADAVGPFVKRAEFEGQELTLRYGLHNGEAVAFCEEKWDA